MMDETYTRRSVLRPADIILILLRNLCFIFLMLKISRVSEIDFSPAPVMGSWRLPWG